MLAFGIGLAMSCGVTGWKGGTMTACMWILCFAPASWFLRCYHATQKEAIAD
jgi:hypothetical protein